MVSNDTSSEQADCYFPILKTTKHKFNQKYLSSIIIIIITIKIIQTVNAVNTENKELNHTNDSSCSLINIIEWGRERRPFVISSSGSLDLVDLHGAGGLAGTIKDQSRGRGSIRYHPIELARAKS